MPHPILKRAHSAHGAAPGPLPYPPAYNVRFPPSPSLTRTFSAHSAAQYDRSPIEVAPNACQLPARGCPGRTYYDNGKPRSDPNRKHLVVAGKALHPRAIAAYEAAQLQEDVEDDQDEAELERTPTRTSPYIPLPIPPPIPASYPAPHPYSPYPLSNAAPNYSSSQYITALPPLVLDLSSSSDESDGFASPPPELANGYYGPASKYGYQAYPPAAPPPSYPYQYPPPSSSPPSQERKRRSRRSPPRQPTVEDGYEEEDLPGSFSHAGAYAFVSVSPPRDRSAKKPKDGRARKDKCGVASLCRSLAGANFREENEGCLGGF